MADKRSFALRVDADMLKAVEKWAADDFRSLNGQIEWLLHKALAESGRLKKKDEKNDKKNRAG
jgi:hypothetical protein